MTRAGLLLLLLLSLPGVASAARWEFRAGYDPKAGLIAVAACSTTAQALVRFTAGLDGAARDRDSATRTGPSPLQRDGDDLLAAQWQAGECLHTRIDAAAAARRDGRRALEPDRLVLDLRRWLWRPTELDLDSTLRFDLPAGWSASVPWTPVAPRIYRLGAMDPDWPARSAFGRFDELALARRGGTVRLALLPPWTTREQARVEPVLRALEQTFGRWPRRDTQVIVVPLRGSREPAPWGEVMRGGNAAVHLFVGADAGPTALIEDWTATHEFSHLLHPHLGPRGRWLGEGLASYYQNVLRARVGVLSAQQAWDQIDAGFARGRAERRSEGLTLTQASQRMHERRNYMRNYWSGAAFWLEADVALRRHGSSLDAVLGVYAECCLERAGFQTPEDFVAALDRLAAGDVFASRYRRYAEGKTFPEIGQVPDDVRTAIMAPK